MLTIIILLPYSVVQGSSRLVPASTACI